MRYLKDASIISMALAMSASASAAQAQEASAKDAVADDIIVTARRSEERLQDVPISITVFNQQQLAQRNITSPV